MAKWYCRNIAGMYCGSVTSQEDPLGTERRFAANLRAFREQAGMSQQAVAEGMQDLGFTYVRQQTLDRIEKGAQRPRLGECHALAMVIGTRLSLMLQSPELADRGRATVLAARDVRAARRAADDARLELRRNRQALTRAIATAEQAGDSGLDPEIALGRRALEDTEGS